MASKRRVAQTREKGGQLGSGHLRAREVILYAKNWSDVSAVAVTFVNSIMIFQPAFICFTPSFSVAQIALSKWLKSHYQSFADRSVSY